MAGVGTIPLEARRLGRVGVANDLSPLAVSVSRAKVESFDPAQVEQVVTSLEHQIEAGPSLTQLEREVDLGFGLNKSIRDYFHPDTLREVVLARRFFAAWPPEGSPCAVDIVRSSVLHILHGNRPYALSRRSHPVTPLAPSGPAIYRPLRVHLRARLRRLLPQLLSLQGASPPGLAVMGDFRDLHVGQVDWVITSPPFSRSVRFWSMN
jgi:hypothetical protein